MLLLLAFVVFFYLLLLYLSLLMSAPSVTIQKVYFAEFNRDDQMAAIYSPRASRAAGTFFIYFFFFFLLALNRRGGNSLVPNLHSFGLVAGELMNLIALPFSWK